MSVPDSYLYFLGCLPDADFRAELAGLKGPTGQSMGGVRTDMLHLTVCVVTQTSERAPFVAPRLDAALSGFGLPSAPVRFGRVRGGKGGAAVRTRGRRREYRAFQDALLDQLAEREIVVACEKKQPHITLGHIPCQFEPFDISREWIPEEIVLIESEMGRTRHNVLRRWSLLPPLQGSFSFDEPTAPIPPMQASGGGR